MKRVIILLVLTVLFIGCTNKRFDIIEKDGVKIVNNSGEPVAESERVSLTKVGEIVGFDEIANPDTLDFFGCFDVAIDAKGNIFVDDYPKSRIIKYNANLERVKQFGNAGNGPGEFQDYRTNIFMKGDTLVVRQISKEMLFSQDGEFFREKLYNKVYCIEPLILFYDNNVEIQNNEFNYYDDNEEQFYTRYISKKVNNKEVKRSSEKVEINYKSIWTKVLKIPSICKADDKHFYYGIRDWEKYQIKLLDLDFKEKMIINMPFTDRKFPQEAIAEKKKLLKDKYNGSSWQAYFEHKLAYADVHFDEKSGLLFVEKQESFLPKITEFDIFKDGVYLNTVKIPYVDEWLSRPFAVSLYLVKDGYLYFVNHKANKIEKYKINYKG